MIKPLSCERSFGKTALNESKKNKMLRSTTFFGGKDLMASSKGKLDIDIEESIEFSDRKSLQKVMKSKTIRKIDTKSNEQIQKGIDLGK